MATIKFINPITGESESIETGRKVTALMVCNNSETGETSIAITGMKNVQTAFNRETSYNRPWLTDWMLVTNFEVVA